MRININGIWHDAELEPIQLELSDSDKKNIANMDPRAKNYIAFPENMPWEEVESILNI